MTDAALPAPEALVLDADRGKLRTALRRNAVLLAVYGGSSLVVVGGIIALAVSDIGRLATYFLLGLLLVILFANLALVMTLRRRLMRFRRAADPLLIVSAQAIVFSGIPPVPWADVLGVIYMDERANLARGGGIGRWMKSLTYRAGGSQVAIQLGIDRPRRFRDGAEGGLVGYLSSSFDLGGISMPLDTAFSDAQLAALRDQLRAVAATGAVAYLESADPQRVAKAAGAMGAGERLPRDA